MIRPAGEIIGDEISDAVSALLPCVTPIFAVGGKREPRLLGSSVLLSVAEYVFLCTAKHVIDENATSTLYIDGGGCLEILEGEFRVSEQYDVAVLRLSSEQVAKLKRYRPLRPDEIATELQTSSSRYVGFMGYPETKNRVKFNRNEVRRHAFLFGCVPIQVNLQKIRVSFNRKRNILAKSRARALAPEPYGMSGGAMFGATVTASAITGNPTPRLVGISTDVPNPNEVFGTNISVVMAIIRDAYGTAMPFRLNSSFRVSSSSLAIVRNQTTLKAKVS